MCELKLKRAKACDGGEVLGRYGLGILYEYNQGVRQNFSTAKQYYGKAYDLGVGSGCEQYRKLNTIGY